MPSTPHSTHLSFRRRSPSQSNRCRYRETSDKAIRGDAALLSLSKQYGHRARTHPGTRSNLLLDKQPFQLPLHQLAGGIARQRSRRERDFYRDLEGGETLGEEDAQVCFGNAGAVPQHHDRGRLFAQGGMRDADHAGVDDGGMLVERILDFDAVDVFAAADQHVLGAIEDVTETLGVETGDIAGAQPAIDERFRGGLWILPVAADDARALDHELAHAARRHRVAVRA